MLHNLFTHSILYLVFRVHGEIKTRLRSEWSLRAAVHFYQYLYIYFRQNFIADGRLLQESKAALHCLHFIDEGSILDEEAFVLHSVAIWTAFFIIQRWWVLAALIFALESMF